MSYYVLIVNEFLNDVNPPTLLPDIVEHCEGGVFEEAK